MVRYINSNRSSFRAILALREAERIGIGEDNLIDLLLYAIPLALIGARIYYVAFTWDYFKQNQRRY